MYAIAHKFLQHAPHPNTEILILGTFNPDTPENIADFFYGRPQNYLWQLLPTAFAQPSLKGATATQKQAFMQNFNIGFIDLIAAVCVEVPNNYNDDYIDARVTLWRDVIGEMRALHQLRKVCFTRKTFADVPHIKNALQPILQYCQQQNIDFGCLPTPTRGYYPSKQDAWTAFFAS